MTTITAEQQQAALTQSGGVTVAEETAAQVSVQGRGRQKGKLRGLAPEPPYCWQCKVALRRIRESNIENVPRALQVYTALTEIASDQQSNIFQTNRGLIGYKAGGLSKVTVTAALKDLVQAKVIRVERPKFRGTKNDGNTIVLVSMGVVKDFDGVKNLNTCSKGEKKSRATSLTHVEHNATDNSSGLCVSESDRDSSVDGKNSADAFHHRSALPGGSAERSSAEERSANRRRQIADGIYGSKLRQQAIRTAFDDDLQKLITNIVSDGSISEDNLEAEIKKQWGALLKDKSNGHLIWSTDNDCIERWNGEDWERFGEESG